MSGIPDEGKKFFRSSKGINLELRPVSQFKIDTVRAQKEELPKPTYEMKVAGGAALEYPLDEEIARNKNRLPEWNEYLEQQKKLDADHAKKFLEMLIWDGVAVDVPDCESEWQKTNAYLGIKVPENPIERKLFYVYNELLGTTADIGDLMAEIFSVSQIDEGAVATLRASFRSALQPKTDKPARKRQGKMDIKSDI